MSPVEPCPDVQLVALGGFDIVPQRWPGWDDVRVVAHRGFGGLFPENTLPALEAAVGLGARAVEVDVRISRDGIPVLVHDPDLGRTTDRVGYVRSLSLSEIKAANACLAHGSTCSVPTLEEALQLLRSRARVLVDMKDAVTCSDVAVILKEIETAGMVQQAAIISHSASVLSYVSILSPETPVGVLGSDLQAVSAASRFRHGEVVMEKSALTENPTLLEAAGGSGIRVNVWTTHNALEILAFLESPAVARVISDVPLQVADSPRMISH